MKKKCIILLSIFVYDVISFIQFEGKIEEQNLHKINLKSHHDE